MSSNDVPIDAPGMNLTDMVNCAQPPSVNGSDGLSTFSEPPVVDPLNFPAPENPLQPPPQPEVEEEIRVSCLKISPHG